MAVYVDDMYKIPMGQFGKMKMSHLYADTVLELHQMADKIGISRKWYQGPPKTINPHYDVCMSKRVLAIEHGAKPVTLREGLKIVKQMRMKAIKDYRNSL